MDKQSRRGALLGCLSFFLLPFLLFLNACGVGVWNMPNVQEILTVAGNTVSLASGEFQVITPGLKDGAGNYLSINQVIVDNGLTHQINNSASPPTVTFFNRTSTTIDQSAYKITHDHTIQTIYPIPSPLVAGVAQAATSGTAKGVFEAWDSSAQSVTPGGTAALVTLENSASYGSASGAVSLAGNIISIGPASPSRSWRITVNVCVSSDAAELITLQIEQDPSGAATVLAQTRASVSAIGEVVMLSLQAVVSTVALSSVPVGVKINSPAGALNVNLGLVKGAHVLVESI